MAVVEVQRASTAVGTLAVAAAVTPATRPAGSWTSLVNPLLRGGGCLGWRRRCVPVVGHLTAVIANVVVFFNVGLAATARPAAAAVLARLMGQAVSPAVCAGLAPARALATEACRCIVFLAACGQNSVIMMPCFAERMTAALLRARRPARGRPIFPIASMIILVFHRHRRGISANVRGAVRRHAALFGEIMEYFNLAYWEEAAPGVAPTSQKRGPWRPPRMGRQGRLPFKKASLRREIPPVLFPCKYFLTTEFTEMKFPRSAGRSTLAQ